MYANIMRLTQDVKVKTVLLTEGEKSVCNNRVAISGPGGDQTTYINVTAWGRLAEFMGEHLKKGDEFYAEGELKNSMIPVYDENGNKKEIQTNYFLIDRIKFTHGNKKEEKKK
ncbi:MAG: single-stranded DNA-binding protein [Eubacteriales bacterium]|nr:single-stranded DNA-binding protein [Eubacteriales bacterium]